jgi:hypothetical protein
MVATIAPYPDHRHQELFRGGGTAVLDPPVGSFPRDRSCLHWCLFRP